MEIEILEKKENLLLDRIEVRFRAVHKSEATPDREKVREQLAKSLKSAKEKVMIDSMDSEFGIGQTNGYAKIYKTVDAAKKFERKHILARNRLVEKEAKKADKK